MSNFWSSQAPVKDEWFDKKTAIYLRLLLNFKNYNLWLSCIFYAGSYRSDKEYIKFTVLFQAFKSSFEYHNINMFTYKFDNITVEEKHLFTLIKAYCIVAKNCNLRLFPEHVSKLI